MSSPNDVTPRRSRRNLFIGIGGAAVVLIAAVGVGVWWFFKDDPPKKQTLDDAIEEVENRTTTTAPNGADGKTTTSAGASNGSAIDGTWTVDTTTGDFDYESATGSYVGFRVDEELQGVGSTEAVGRTNAITGTLTIEGSKLTAVDLTVDLTKLTTDRSMRDNRVQSALHTDEHPDATFTLAAPLDLGDDAADGGKVTTKATGDLTVNGITKQVTFDIEAQLVKDTMVVVGDTEVTLSDFDVEVPSAPIVLSASDTSTVELKLLFEKG